MGEHEILSRRGILEDLLHPIKALTHDTHEVIYFGEEKVFTAAKVATSIKGIKSEKVLENMKSGQRY